MEITRILLQYALVKTLIETGRIVFPEMDTDRDEEKRLHVIGKRVALDTIGAHRYAPIVDFEHFGRRLEAKMKGLSPADFSGIVKYRDMRSIINL
ncbi:hypothetical protein LZ554_009312 [Drepanopeziza brunnea f. sp. 'monogermtubi']|nr:hypothetical protein LZ554_009312 [Drepanopeziza brunnea f. sp. 'monogermtubi']